MLYELKQGPTEAFILEQARKQRGPIPQAIQDAPSLWFGSAFYYESFLKLSSCRINGMGMGRIPYNAVFDFGRARHMSLESIEVLWAITAEMDGVYIDYCNKDQKNKLNGAQANPNPNGMKSVKHLNG